MNINTIVLDIDGTLLNDRKEISLETKAALIKAQEHGIKLVLASGRPTPAMMALGHELKMDEHDGLIVSFNGANAMNFKTKEVLLSDQLDANVARDLFEHLKEFDVIPMIADENYMYVNNVYNNMINIKSHVENDGSLFNIIEYESRAGNYLISEMSDFTKEVDFLLHKVLVAADPVYLQENHQAMMKPFDGILTCVFSAPFFFEFTNVGVDKGATLDKILPTPDSVIAFGDGHNDKTLINYAKVGIAMGNAEDEVKAIADDVTASNNEDGIAKALYKYLPEIFN